MIPHGASFTIRSPDVLCESDGKGGTFLVYFDKGIADHWAIRREIKRRLKWCIPVDDSISSAVLGIEHLDYEKEEPSG